MTVVELDVDPNDDDVAALRVRLRETRARAPAEKERPRLIITPVGLPLANEIARGFEEVGATVAHRRRFHGWSTLSTLLQVTWDEPHGLRKAIAFEALWRQLYPADDCVLCELASVADLERLDVAKPALRERWQGQELSVVTPRFGFRARLHPFHSPVPARAAVEASWLAAGIGLDTL